MIIIIHHIDKIYQYIIVNQVEQNDLFKNDFVQQFLVELEWSKNVTLIKLFACRFKGVNLVL